MLAVRQDFEGNQNFWTPRSLIFSGGSASEEVMRAVKLPFARSASYPVNAGAIERASLEARVLLRKRIQ